MTTITLIFCGNNVEPGSMRTFAGVISENSCTAEALRAGGFVLECSGDLELPASRWHSLALDTRDRADMGVGSNTRNRGSKTVINIWPLGCPARWDIVLPETVGPRGTERIVWSRSDKDRRAEAEQVDKMADTMWSLKKLREGENWDFCTSTCSHRKGRFTESRPSIQNL